MTVSEPGTWSSVANLIRFAYGVHPWLMLATVGLQLLSSLPRPALPLLLAAGVAAATTGDEAGAIAVGATLAGLVLLTWLCAVAAERVGRRFRDLLMIRLEGHVASMLASSSSLEVHEQPELLDSLEVLRYRMFMLDHLFVSIVNVAVWSAQVVAIVVLLGVIHPLLPLVLLAAVPVVVVTAVRLRAENDVQGEAAMHLRLARHYASLGVGAESAKDVRLAGLASLLPSRRTAAWRSWYRPVGRVRARTAAAVSLAWAVFAAVYCGILVWLISTDSISAPGVVLYLGVGVQVIDYVSESASEVGFMTGIFLDAARRLLQLQRIAAPTASGDAEAPGGRPRARPGGLEVRGLSFAYPGSQEPVLRGIDLDAAPGTTIALVGDNGSGKTTLVKVLAGLYPVEHGTVRLGETTLRAGGERRWRAGVTAVFQDAARFEVTAREAIGLGDLPRIDDFDGVVAAARAGRAHDLVESLRDGYDTQLGAGWPGGVGLSTGQWQRIAIARAAMRVDHALRLVDEPGASLDPLTEDALTADLLRSARTGASDGVTIVVSHRFATVREADRIVLLDEGSIVEQGTHDELMAADGRYAAAYAAQRRGYVGPDATT